MRPLVPLPGFNTRPLGRIPTTCCGCFSRDTKRSNWGTYYCPDCRASFDRFSRAKFGGDETAAASFQLQTEGVEAVRAWAL
jgi:hypothetical protein